MNETSDMDVSYFFATHITCSASVRSLLIVVTFGTREEAVMSRSCFALPLLAGQMVYLTIVHLIFLPV
jgi:hypothetical protein